MSFFICLLMTRWAISSLPGPICIQIIVRFFAPCFTRAFIRGTGVPAVKNPAIAIEAPSGISATAESASGYTLSNTGPPNSSPSYGFHNRLLLPPLEGRYRCCYKLSANPTRSAKVLSPGQAWPAGRREYLLRQADGRSVLTWRAVREPLHHPP